MPQIMIDTASESAATLRETAAMLIFIADRMASNVPPGTVDPVVALVQRVQADTAVASIPPPPAAIIPPPPPPAPDTTATTASAASTAPSVPNGAPVQLDKAGFPWDARIHSETPTINKSDGLWRMKRGIGDKRDVVEAVEAELRANYPAPVAAPQASTAIPPPPVSLPAAPVIPPPPAVVAAPAAPAATVMVPPPPPVVGSVPAGTDASGVDAFRALMNKVAGHTGPEGRLRREIMVPIYEQLGCKSLTDFHKERAKIPALLEQIEALLA